MLNEHLFEMIEGCKKAGIGNVKTVINGTLLNQKNIQRILESRLDSIEISLDGMSVEENDLIRRGSRGEKIAAQIKNLLQSKKLQQKTLKVMISSTIFSASVSGRSWVEDFFQEELADGSLTIQKNQAITWSKMDVNHTLFDVVDSGGESCNYCDHVISTTTIRANGDIVPCCYDLTSEMVMGNINETPLEKIWLGEKYTNLRQSIQDKKFISLCRNCAVVQPARNLRLKENLA